jgi:hypothetical protein
MKETYQDSFQFLTDGRTVWVNSSDAGAIGHLGPNGIDVHNKTNDACLDCGPIDPSQEGVWQRFCTAMHRMHGAVVPENFKPDWCL